LARFALLILPTINRVYAAASVELAKAELQIFGRSVLSAPVGDIADATIGGIPYVTFEASGLTDRDAALLGNMSSIYALFERDGERLRPIELRKLDVFDDDLITIQKYQGKTNENFTKLLLNVTLLSSAFAGEMLERRFTVFDPLCGRGTTLNQALMYGFDAAGIDIDSRDFDGYSTFIRTWLKRKRIKHQVEAGPVRRDHKVIGKRLRIELGASKERYKSGDRLNLMVVNADTSTALCFYRPDSFDLLVADAPYGVQHGSRTVTAGLTRRPLDLLREAIPVWAKLVRPGGALGIAWNVNVARRRQTVQVLVDAGLDVLDSAPHTAFEHRVDHAIVRDILVARKP
jgi:SAM-dependent methyltransferase